MRVLLATVVVAGVGASSGIDADLRMQISELEKLLSSQQEDIAILEADGHSLEEKFDSGRFARRLDDSNLTASIHGAYDADHRAYTQAENVAGALNSMWFILCGALVMFMQAGFAMVESGICRVKNVQNVLLKNMTDVCMGTFGWWLCGWAFAYSGPMEDDNGESLKQNRFMGYEEWLGHTFLSDIDSHGNIEPTNKMENWFFQWAFCSAAATIVSGGVMERCNFWAYSIYSFLMTAFIYPVVVAWTWGYGFLYEAGYMDFAGSGIVHMSGGVGALVGAIVAGPRKGRFDGLTTKLEIIFDCPASYCPHSQPTVVLGTFILWFGWYGFNCGSTLGMATAERGMMGAQVAMNTTLSAATGGLVVFLIRFAATKKYDIGGFCNGILAGLVSITAGCGNVECGSAVCIGFCGGLIFSLASAVLKLCKVDDPVDAFAVHGACGAWGTIAAGLFDWGIGAKHAHGWTGFDCIRDSSTNTCATDEGGRLVGANFLEVFVICLWVASLSAVIFIPLKAAGFLKPKDEILEDGFDARKHSPSKAYVIETVPSTVI